MIQLYILIAGIVLVIMGTAELIMPLRAFAFWRSWISKKQFFLHGLLLIAAGFPLTIYTGPLSTVIFIMGLLAVLSGPFVLLYSNKIRTLFEALSHDIQESQVKKMICVEGSLRIAAGLICAASFFLR
jgi:hypothetical protein